MDTVKKGERAGIAALFAACAALGVWAGAGDGSAGREGRDRLDAGGEGRSGCDPGQARRRRASAAALEMPVWRQPGAGFAGKGLFLI